MSDQNKLVERFTAFVVAEEPWRQRAKCRELAVPTEAFFPMRGTSQKLAKRTCARCPVQVECDEYGDRSGSEYGIWGGRIRHRSSHANDPQDAVAEIV